MFRLFALALVAGAAAAQQPLRLDDVVREALKSNPDILAAQKRYEASRQRAPQESALPDPMLSLTYNSVGSPRPFAGIGSEPVANAGAMVSQEFPFPGKRKLRGEIASRESDAEYQQYLQVQLGVVSRLKQAFHRLHHDYAMLDILDRDRDLLQQFLRIGEARYSVGKAAQQDIFKAQTQLSILETRRERLIQDRFSREAEIAALLNRPPNAPIARPEEENPTPLKASLQDLLTQVAKRAPMLQRDQKMIERSELALDLARKDNYPDYTLSGGWFSMGSMGNMYMARVDFKLPWFWGKQRAEVAEQAANLSQARAGYEATGRALAARVKDDYLVADTSYRLMQMYTGTVIPQSRLALESSLSSYQTGAVDFLSVLTNFQTTLEYELAYHEEMQTYFLALARLEEMTGLKL